MLRSHHISILLFLICIFTVNAFSQNGEIIGIDENKLKSEKDPIKSMYLISDEKFRAKDSLNALYDEILNKYSDNTYVISMLKKEQSIWLEYVRLHLTLVYPEKIGDKEVIQASVDRYWVIREEAELYWARYNELMKWKKPLDHGLYGAYFKTDLLLK